MKLQLNESGLRNIKELSKKYNEAWIYGHIDLDGITSSLVMKYYLAQYGIKTTEWIPIQYGAPEYAIAKVPENILGVLVDFSHGKVQFKIHTDHHSSQIQYPNQSKHFAHSKSNADTISSVISPSIIMSPEDMRIINMVDSAGYADEGISVKDIKNYVYNFKKDSTNKENQLKFGMVVNKLLLAYKNKPGYLRNVVLNSKPSLMSMYNVMMREINSHIAAGDKGWSDPATLQKNSEWYRERQKENILANGSVNSINELKRGKNAVIGDCVVQVGGGQMNKIGSYDRYTAFDLHPECKYFVMIWDTIGMMQVSTNNWNKSLDKESIDLGELVLKQIFEGKYKPLLDKPKYAISLLAIKKLYEENINEQNELTAIGFDMNAFKELMQTDFDLTPKQQKWLETCMSYKPSQLTPSESDNPKTKEYKYKCAKFLNTFKIPLSEIILKTSGGHKTITNLNGFGFLNEQQRINNAIRNKRSPYEKLNTPSDKKSTGKSEYESTSLKILKSIAKDVVNSLNKSPLKESDEILDAIEDFKVGDKFLWNQKGFKVTGKILEITKIEDEPNLPDHKKYILEDEDKKYQITFTKSTLVRKLMTDYMEKIDPEPEDDGSFMTETIKYIKETDEGEIPEEGPYLGYDTVFTYHGYDFAVEHIVEGEGSYYNVVVYKTNLTDDEEAYITEQMLPSWIDVMKYARDFDSCKANRFRYSWHNGVETEPEEEGDELNENVNDDIDRETPPDLYDERTYKCGPYTYSIEYTDDGDDTKYFSVIAYKKLANDSRTNDDEYDIEEIDNVAFSTWNECINYMKSMRELYYIRKNNFMDRTATEPENDGDELNESVDLDTPEIPPLELGETETYRYKGYEAVITCEENEEGEYYYARIYFDSDENHAVCRREVVYTEWDMLLEYIKMYASAHPLHTEEKTEPEDDGADMLESLLNETKPSRFNKHLDDKEKSFATISAERSMPQIDNRERQRALNHRRTKVLEKLLKAWGLKGFIKTKGGFDEKGQPRVEINGNLSEEDSFFVPNITKEQAVRLGKLFNQDSVMFKDKGSNKIKELRTNIKGGDEGIGNETGLVFITCQGRHNIGHDKTYYTRTKSSPVKFAFNPEDESSS